MQQIVYLINCKDMMKRLFTLCLALTSMTLGAMAAEELYVGGKISYGDRHLGLQSCLSWGFSHDY